MRGLAVEVGGRVPRHDRLQVRRLQGRDHRLDRAEVADADHADLPVAPGLFCDPLDQVVAVLGLLCGEPAAVLATRAADPAQVGDHVHVPVPGQVLGVTGLDRPVVDGRPGPGGQPERLRRDRQRLDVLAIGRHREQRRVAAFGRRTKDVGAELDAVAHRDESISLGEAGHLPRHPLASRFSRRRSKPLRRVRAHRRPAGPRPRVPADTRAPTARPRWGRARRARRRR
jgi:hypothetical protein